MSRFEVETSQLTGAGAGHAALAGDLSGLGAQVGEHAGAAAAAIGDAHAGGVLADTGDAWAASLNGLADAVSRLGVNLDAAARAYAQVDEDVMPLPR
jgi:uncharacterized protein YukE